MKRIAALILALLLTLAAGCTGAAPQPNGGTSGSTTQSQPTTTTTQTPTTTTTAPADIPSTMQLKQLGQLQYYLYTPRNPTEDMPLILYLHGSPNKTADVTSLLTTDGLPKYLYEGYYGDVRAYVAIPKLEDGYKRWMDISDQILNLIQSIHTDHAIDQAKIALTGFSMGGTGVYQLQTAFPDTFACFAPVSGTIKPAQADLTALGKAKMWAFVGTKDTVVNPNSSVQVVKALQEKGADAKITELKGAKHTEMPALAYQDLDLIRWLVACGR